MKKDNNKTLTDLVFQYFEDNENKGIMKDIRAELSKAESENDIDKILEIKEKITDCPGITMLEYPQLYNRKHIEKALLKMTNKVKIIFLNKLIDKWNSDIENLNEYWKKDTLSDKKFRTQSFKIVRCSFCEHKPFCRSLNLGMLVNTYKRELKSIQEQSDPECDQGQGKKKRKTWTDQERKKFIVEFIEFRDSKKGKSLEDIKSLWDKNIVLKSDKRIPRASGLKNWIEDGKYTMTDIRKENIPDLRIFIKD